MGLTSSTSRSGFSRKVFKRPRVKIKKFNESQPPEFIVGKSVPAEVMPRWADKVRGMAPALLRGALFGIFHDKRPLVVKEQIMCSLRGTLIQFSGALLNQRDLDVLIEILHLWRGKKFTEKIFVSRHDLLRRLGLKRSGQNYKMLQASIQRLSSGIVKVSTNNEKFQGPLISIDDEHANAGQLAFRVHQEIGSLFPNNTWSQFNPNVRNALGKNLLARWLHAYFTTHVRPFPMTVEKIHQLCGSKQIKEREFRRQLKVAFKAIKDASKSHNDSFDFKIVKEKGIYKVLVAPHPSPSQARYADRNAIRRASLKERNRSKAPLTEKVLPPDPAFNDEEEF